MSGSNNAAKQAQQNEDARNAQIQDSTNQINSIFDNPARQAQYSQLGKDTTNYYTQQLDQQQLKASNNLTFAMARNGQSGGSVSADQGTQLGKDYLNGVLDVQRRGDAAAAGLQAQDETSRANLIAAAQGGLDSTSAASQAASMLQSNVNNAKSNADSSALGNTFGDFSTLYQNSQNAAALRAGQKYAYGTVYGSGFGYNAGSSGGPVPPQGPYGPGSYA